MCGIAGLISFGRAPDAASVVRDMTAALTLRGPDGEGWWSDGEAALGHRRLAIIDVVGGAQPLVNETGSVRVVCNGEIYNYRELRSELQARGHHFRTASDCETIAHLYEDDGPDAVAKLHGMFALAIWDRAAERLVLARDRLGIKPLFYTSGPRGFGFASEIKALVAGRLTQRQVDPGALLHYLSCGYVPGAATIYRDVQRLAPGELLVADRDGVERRPYWGWQPGLAPRSRAAAEEELRSLLMAAVREHLVADVPVGAFLSGGIDSSVVSILAAAASPTPLRTFSVTFPEDRVFDEARFSRQVVRQIGSGHTEIPLTRAQVLSAVEPALDHLDEPFADPSLVPCFEIAREARRHVKVVLSGDGADELFGGYTKYLGEAYAARAPFLDHRVVEFAFRVPGRWKIGGMRGKRILRRTFRDLLPPEVRRRGKRGFEPPVGEWFRTELRDLFWDVMKTGSRYLPCVRRDAVETLYRQHATRRADRSKELWALFELHWWASRQRTGV